VPDDRKIVKKADGWHVYSEDGSKHLGGPYQSEKQAKKRLEQVEYFKNKGKNDMILTPERRFVPFEEAELRLTEEQSGAKYIVGKAAVFNKLSQNLGGFVEKLDPKTFDKVLKTADVRVLRNHNPDKLLGRTKSGTAELWTDDNALWYKARVGNTSTHRDTVEHIRDGDMDGSSFSFTVDDGGDEWLDPTEPGGPYTRIVHSVRDLFDVGPVTYPAYLDTTTAARDRPECRSFERYIESRARNGQREEEARNALNVQRVRILKLRLGYPIF
jgi:uncharacterized protein